MEKPLIKIKKIIEQELSKIDHSKAVKRLEERKAFLRLQAAYLQLEEGLRILTEGDEKTTASK